MVFTKDSKFDVHLVDDEGKDYKEFFPKEKNSAPYIVGEKSRSFTIRMEVNCTKTDIKKFYGAKLYIDGEEVPGIKTFKGTGRYFGFKLGAGRYKKFVFGTPTYSFDDKNNENKSKDIGKIRIIFYTTKEVKNKEPVKSIPHNYKSRENKYLDSNKKLCFKSLQVVEGEIFDNGHTTRQRLREEKNLKESLYSHVIDYQDDIDDLDLNYSDFYGLLTLGMISINNLKDLRYIPTSPINYLSFLNAITVIVDKHKNDKHEIFIKDLAERFASYCEHPVSVYFDNDHNSLESLLYKHNDKFSISQNINGDYVLTSKITKLKKDINDISLIKTDYLLSGVEKKYLEKVGEERHYRKMNQESGTAMRVDQDNSTFVDLTYDDEINF